MGLALEPAVRPAKVGLISATIPCPLKDPAENAGGSLRPFSRRPSGLAYRGVDRERTKRAAPAGRKAFEAENRPNRIASPLRDSLVEGCSCARLASLIISERKAQMRALVVRLSLVLAAILAVAVARGRSTSGGGDLAYPLVAGHGGVVPLPEAAEQPRAGVKAVFDITADAKPEEVNKGLERIARLLNLYGAAGLTARDVKVAAVFHCPADKAVLSDAAYAARYGVAANPNLPLIRTLKDAGVELFVCGQSLHDLGFDAGEVAGEVPVAASAMLVLANKQTDGYAYIQAR
jgi:intracellular sulfur oxidation DsrE/DsrF family protein